MLKSKFWYGVEVEGRFINLPTLFIVGDRTTDEIEQKIFKLPLLISHLYFGAGNQSIVTNYKTIRHFLRQGYTISYEVIYENLHKVPKDILQKAHILVCFKRDIEKIKTHDTIKFETRKNIYCVTKGNMFKNDYKVYKNDKVI